MKRLLALIVAACSLALAGCGGGGTPAEAVTELAYAMEDGDADKLKKLMPELGDYLSDSKIETLAKQMAQQAKAEGGIKSVRIEEETINGDTAIVKATMVKGNGNEDYEEFELTKVKGRWVISMGDDLAKPGGSGLNFGPTGQPNIDIDLGSEFEDIEDTEPIEGLEPIGEPNN